LLVLHIMLREKNDVDNDVYVCTTILLHYIAIRQNRIIEKGGNERERIYTYIQANTLREATADKDKD